LTLLQKEIIPLTNLVVILLVEQAKINQVELKAEIVAKVVTLLINPNSNPIEQEVNRSQTQALKEC
jgi:hypothetical protein